MIQVFIFVYWSKKRILSLSNANASMGVCYIYGDTWGLFYKELESLIVRKKIKRIGEIGAGSHPALSPDFVKKHQLQYDVFDIDAKELHKLDTSLHQCRAFQCDFEQKNLLLEESYDLFFTKMVLEHIESVAVFHENILNNLSDGGFALHFFPCISSLPISVNALLPEAWSTKLLQRVQPWRTAESHAKHKAYYKWCWGPTPSHLNYYQNMGFSVVRFTGFFGHHYYDKAWPWLRQLYHLKNRLLNRFPSPYLCANSLILLRKPTVYQPSAWPHTQKIS